MRNRKERRYLTNVKIAQRIQHFRENQWEMLLEPHSLHKKSPFKSAKIKRKNEFNAKEMYEL